MLDIEGFQLSDAESERLSHPMVGGLILFSRNYQDREQLNSLVAQIRSVRPEVLIAVDHEGGRVQRFIDGFTKIPAMGDILPSANGDLTVAGDWCEELGFLMAVELIACDIDLSFAPVLDLNGISQVIGKRSFSAQPEQVSQLAERFIKGMRAAGMGAVGKHFPGHGSVEADSHIAMPVDLRSMEQVEAADMIPFRELISKSQLDGVMPAHVVYSKIDSEAAGFSQFWLQDMLRQSLGFDGVIFSDDLGMKGAAVAGSYCQRAQAAIAAGCDMILLCNDATGVTELLEEFQWPEHKPAKSIQALRIDATMAAEALGNEQRWQNAKSLALSI